MIVLTLISDLKLVTIYSKGRLKLDKTNPTKIDRTIAKILGSGKQDLYVVYYDEKDSAIHLDIKAEAINRLANSNPTLIPLLIKTLATATQMMSEDYLTMLQAAMEGNRKGGIHITDALPKPRVS